MLLAQDIRPLPRSPQQRLVSVAIVASLHVVVIAGILVSLNKIPLPAPVTDIIIEPVPPVKSTETPPPPQPVLADPQKVSVPKPDITIVESNPTGTITNIVPQQPTRPVDPVRTMPAYPITGTHTTPDYPPIDARMGHEGQVQLKLAINEWGAVTDAQIERSSGFETLDRAAAEWVKSHWLYHPATRAGDGVPSTAEVTVTFRLTGRQ